MPRVVLGVEALEDRFLLNASLPVQDALLQSETEPNDKVAQANPITLSPSWWVYPLATAAVADIYWPFSPVPLNGSIGGDLSANAPEADVDFFSFSTDPEQQITVTLTGAAVLDGASPVLLDADGKPIPDVAATADPNAENTLTLVFYTRAGGQFFIRVGPGSDTNGDDDSSYCLHVSVAADPTHEHETNDTLAQANALQLYPVFWVYLAAPLSPEVYRVADVAPDFAPYPWFGAQQYANVSGNLDNTEQTSDVDVFSFSSPAARKITLTLDGDAATAGAVVELLDEKGNVIATGQNVSYYTSAGGSFYARVQSAADAKPAAAGAYNLHVSVVTDPYEEHEPNDSFDTANPIVSWWYYPGPIPLLSAADAAANVIARPIYWNPNLAGYITGQIDSADDQDFFSIPVSDHQSLHVALTGDLSGSDGRITLYDANHQELATDDDGSDGLTIDWTVHDAGTFYLRVDRPKADSNADAASNQYRVDVTSSRIIEPYQGPDEYEPNNDTTTANYIGLYDATPAGSTAMTLRTGAALGIAGGPTNDKDYFQFYLRAGEHVHVGARELGAGGVQLTVFDANGKEIGSSAPDADGVVFDVPADGTYYALVSAVPTASDALVNYRLCVSATSGSASSDDPDAYVMTLGPGQTFDFTDASGDAVHLAYKGYHGTATITFTGAQADGSDIASVVINGCGRGRFFVQTAGSAQVGKVIVLGRQHRNRVVGLVSQIYIDGNLGSLTSDAHIGKLKVSGLLGDIAAPGKHIARVTADTFDTTLACVAKIRHLHVEHDALAAAIEAFLAVGENGNS